jgi:hypothetical protein
MAGVRHFYGTASADSLHPSLLSWWPIYSYLDGDLYPCLLTWWLAAIVGGWRCPVFSDGCWRWLQFALLWQSCLIF